MEQVPVGRTSCPIMLTDGDVVRVVRLQQPIETSPDVRQPVDHLVHPVRRPVVLPLLVVASTTAATGPRGGQSPAEVAAGKAEQRLGVVGAEHPAEVVVQLETRRRAGRLVCRPDDVRAALRHNGESIDLRTALSRSRAA